MRSVVFAAVILITFSSCNEKKGGDSGGSNPAVVTPGTDAATDPATETTTASNTATNTQNAVIGGTVAIDLEPKDGVAVESVSGAMLSVEGHPELTATADAQGVASIGPMVPGTVSIIVLSGDGSAGLVAGGASKYGLLIPDIVVPGGKTTDLGNKVLKETGTITGSAAFYSNPNDLDLLGTEVFIPGTPFLIKTGSDGAFTLAGVPEGTYTIVVQHTGFAVLKIESVNVVEGKTTNLGTAALSLSNGPEGAIAVTADLTRDLIGSAMKIATNRVVTMALSYDKDAALMKVSNEPAFLNKEWEPVTATKNWTFTTDGRKTLYVMYSDLNGLESSPFSDDIYVDTELPIVSSIEVLNGWEQSAKPTVFLDNVAGDSGSGIESIILSNDAGFATKSILNYATHIETWAIDSLISPTAGPKTVYIKVKDYAGNESVVVSDAINLDPAGSTLIYPKTYFNPIKLRIAQQPYLVAAGGASPPTFEGGLEIESGVTLTIDSSMQLVMKSALKAQGTDIAGVKSIIIKSDSTDTSCATISGPVVKLNEAAPGISNATVVKNVEFRRITQIYVNGGSFESNRFNSLCAAHTNPDYGVPTPITKIRVEKTGLDVVSFLKNEFNHYTVALIVRAGSGNTTFRGNHGEAGIMLVQGGTASGTIFSNNNFEISYQALRFDNGTLNQTSDSQNRFTAVNLGSAPRVVNISGSAQVVLNGIRAEPGFSFLQTGSGNDAPNGCNLTITNSRIEDLISGISFMHSSGAASVIVSNSTVEFATSITDDFFRLVSYDQWAASANSSSTATFSGNDINVTYDLNDDFFFSASKVWSADYAPTFVMTGNDVSCAGSDADEGCHGFVVYNVNATGSHDAKMALTLDNNYFLGKTIVGAVNAPRVLPSFMTNTYDPGELELVEFSEGQTFNVNWVVSAATPTAGSAVAAGGPALACTGTGVLASCLLQ